jgi:hypothetical protein
MCSRTSGGVAQAPIATVLDAIKQSDRVFMAGFPSRSDRSSMFVRSLKNAIHRKVTDDFISRQDGLRPKGHAAQQPPMDVHYAVARLK